MRKKFQLSHLKLDFKVYYFYEKCILAKYCLCIIFVKMISNRTTSFVIHTIYENMRFKFRHVKLSWTESISKIGFLLHIILNARFYVKSIFYLLVWTLKWFPHSFQPLWNLRHSWLTPQTLRQARPSFFPLGFCRELLITNSSLANN